MLQVYDYDKIVKYKQNRLTGKYPVINTGIAMPNKTTQ